MLAATVWKDPSPSFSFLMEVGNLKSKVRLNLFGSWTMVERGHIAFTHTNVYHIYKLRTLSTVTQMIFGIAY